MALYKEALTKLPFLQTDRGFMPIHSCDNGISGKGWGEQIVNSVSLLTCIGV